jgi:hypothetical protein
MRNFLCEATGVNCTDPRCKRGSCIMEQEAVAKALTKAARKDASAAKAGRARSIRAATRSSPTLKLLTAPVRTMRMADTSASICLRSNTCSFVNTTPMAARPSPKPRKIGGGELGPKQKRANPTVSRLGAFAPQHSASERVCYCAYL